MNTENRIIMNTKNMVVGVFGALAATCAWAAEIPQAEMEKIYNEVKTPYKYGVILEPEEGYMLDNPNVFRYGGKWYMLYIVFDKKGYETHLAASDDLLRWRKLGKVLPYGKPGAWDSAQSDGGPSLFHMEWNDPPWKGGNQLGKFDGKYWMTYIGGALHGYETDPLSIGAAWTLDPGGIKEWTRLEKPILTPFDADARAFEKKTLFKSFVVDDPTKKLGKRFVMYYNAKCEGEWIERIGMAVSDDMVNWKRYGDGPCVANEGELDHGLTGDPMVRKIGDTYVMFYFGFNWDRKGGQAFDTFAASKDLVHWTKWTGPKLVSSSEPWDKTHAHKPWVLKHEGVVYHFYCAVGNKGRVLALATSKPVKAKPEVWYELDDFKKGIHGVFGGRRFGGRLNPNNGWWALNFACGDWDRLWGNMELPGKPSRLRLTFDAPAKAAGTELVVKMAVGFAEMKKVLGVIPAPKPGEKKVHCVFETPVPPDKSWQWTNSEFEEFPNGKGYRMRNIEVNRANAVHEPFALEMKALEFLLVPNGKYVLSNGKIDRLTGSEYPSIVTALAQNLGAEPISGVYRVTVKNWNGDVLGTVEKQVADVKPGEARLFDLALPKFPAGLNYLGFEGRLEKDGNLLSDLPFQSSWVRDVPLQADKTPCPDLPWGMGIYPKRARWLGGSDADKRARAERWIERAVAAGVKWTRQEVDWNDFAAKEGAYDFSSCDELIDLSLKHGLTIYGSIACGHPPWVKPWTQQMVDEYAKALRAAVKRYKDRIHYWEIWNEPNLYCFWHADEALYHDMLRKCIRAVKEEDPTAKVVGGDTAGVAKDYHAKCLEKAPGFDDFAFHPYRKHFVEKTFLEDIRSVTGLKPGSKAWMSEMGWYTDGRFSTERSQAVNLARAYLTSATEPSVGAIFWYDFACDGPDPTSEDNFGIMRFGGDIPKPGYLALATVCRRMNAGKFEFRQKKLDGGKTLFVLRSGSRKAVWTDSEKPVEIPVGEKDDPVNLMGEKLTPNAAGKLVVDVDHPVFL